MVRDADHLRMIEKHCAVVSVVFYRDDWHSCRVSYLLPRESVVRACLVVDQVMRGLEALEEVYLLDE